MEQEPDPQRKEVLMMEQPSPVILVVEDDVATLKLLSYSLRRHAPTSTVVTAESGRSALQYLAESPISLLLTDYLLPDMDGLQLVAAVKAASPATYVVLCSVDDTRDIRKRAQEHGVDQFLSKLDLLARLGEVVRVGLGRTGE
ncbi:MAG TPA: response regulator [Roseiflexaceae bacterium]|nr:response regulator [Roseiflexaceae bacterium]